MKFGKVLGLSLLYLGMILILFGLIAATLPLLENEQIRLILASFEAPAPSEVLGFINQLFLNMIRYHLEMCLIGGGMTMLGLLLILALKRKKPKKKPSPVAKASKSFIPSAPVPPPNSLADVSNDAFAHPSVDWRRPASSASSQSNLTADSPLSSASFSSILPKNGILNTPASPPFVQEENPYLCYGQSAYAPPANESYPETAESPAQSDPQGHSHSSPSLQEMADNSNMLSENLSDTVWDDTAWDDTTWNDPPQPDPSHANGSLHRPHLFEKPSVEPSTLQPLEPSPSFPLAATENITFASEPAPPLHSLEVPSEHLFPLPLPMQNALPQKAEFLPNMEPDPLPKVQYFSNRIRSTVGRSV